MQKNKIASTHLFSSATVTLLSMIFSVFISLIPILVVLILNVFTVNKIIKIDLKAVLSFTFAAAIIMVLNKSSLRHFTPFLGGIIVASIMNMKKTEAIFKQKKYTILALLLLGVSVYFFNGGKKPIQIIISSLVFLIIASGNSFFGILSSAFSRKFGQITYSLYLLHGIFLFILFHFVVGLERAKTLTDLEFWMIVTVSILPLLFICQLTFKYIESPLMSFSKTKK